MKLLKSVAPADEPVVTAPSVAPSPAPLTAVEQAREDLQRATGALAEGARLIGVAQSAVAEVGARAAALDDTVTAAELAAADAELALAQRRLPALEANALAAQADLHQAEADELVESFLAWWGGSEAEVLASVDVVRTALASLMQRVSAHNAELFAVRMRVDALPEVAGARLKLDKRNARLLFDTFPVDYATPVEWVSRLVGEALLTLPNGEGHRLGTDMLEAGRIVYPAPPGDRPQRGFMPSSTPRVPPSISHGWESQL